jgi:dTDP-4-amino-4,6-dideoxygalactose transaminase
MSGLQKRAQVRQWYIEALADIPAIIIPFKDYPDFSSNYIFPIVLKNAGAEKRDAVRAKLTENGIQTSMHYPAVHRFSIYKQYYKELPVTDYLVNNLITLPMYSKLTKDQITFICNTLNESL